MFVSTALMAAVDTPTPSHSGWLGDREKGETLPSYENLFGSFIYMFSHSIIYNNRQKVPMYSLAYTSERANNNTQNNNKSIDITEPLNSVCVCRVPIIIR